jgi:Fic family protein
LQGLSLNAFGEDFYFLLARTSHELGVLDVLSSRIPNIDLFLSMHIRKEALLSSQIEGTQATLDDILDPRREKNQNLNVAEVINYIQAVHFALDRLNTLPLCNRLLREAHGILLAGNRGEDKSPGEFRRSQNWIGGAGSVIKTARYIPPSPDDMIRAMDDLEQYLNGESGPDPLIRAGLIHYQFETIHPFLDGNGRIGRLLAILYLCEKKVLAKPVLYISCFLKQNRQEYYDRLSLVRTKGDYEQWVRFFVRIVHDTAVDAIASINALSELRKRNIQKIAALGRSAKTARRLYDYLEQSPIIEIGKTAADLGLSFNTVTKAVGHLCVLGILKQTEPAAGRLAERNRTFAYTNYLDILRQGC